MNSKSNIASSSAIGRRHFISTAAGATLGMAGRAAAARNPKPIRLGVAGGRFGNTFHCFADHPDCEVVAVTDLRPKRRERMMQAFRCGKSYESLEEMVKASDIDAIAIFTDGNLHVDHTVLAMKHGKHVLCAVPAAWGNYERADLLYETVKSSGLTYMMAETSVFSDFAMSAREFQAEGRFGEIYLFESAYHHPGLEELYFENGSDGPP